MRLAIVSGVPTGATSASQPGVRDAGRARHRTGDGAPALARCYFRQIAAMCVPQV